MKIKKNEIAQQINIFREATRELGADESEDVFDAALKRVGRHQQKPAAEAPVSQA